MKVKSNALALNTSECLHKGTPKNKFFNLVGWASLPVRAYSYHSIQSHNQNWAFFIQTAEAAYLTVRWRYFSVNTSSQLNLLIK